MATLEDVFQVTHNVQLLGVNMANMYHALRANPGENAQEINDAFANSVIPDINDWQSTDLLNVNLICFSLGDPEDFHTQALGDPGDRAVTNSPAHIAPGVRFPSRNRLIRSGQKRFTGANELDYTDGTLGGTAITLLENIGDALVGNWLASADSHHVANYIIVKRVCKLEDPVTGKCLKYGLPELDEDLLFYQPDTHLVNPEISSQVSRKTF